MRTRFGNAPSPAWRHSSARNSQRGVARRQPRHTPCLKDALRVFPGQGLLRTDNVLFIICAIPVKSSPYPDGTAHTADQPHTRKHHGPDPAPRCAAPKPPVCGERCFQRPRWQGRHGGIQRWCSARGAGELSPRAAKRAWPKGHHGPGCTSNPGRLLFCTDFCHPHPPRRRTR